MKPLIILIAVQAVLCSAATSSGCSSGIQAILASLKDYPPAQSFCYAKYPKTITESAGAPKFKRIPQIATTTRSKSTSSSTTISTTASTTTSTKKATTTSTTKSLTTSASSTFTTSSTTPSTTTTSASKPTSSTSKSTSSTKNPKEALYSSLVAQASAAVSTFCACNFPPVTVTKTSSTTSSTTPAVTTTSSSTTTSSTASSSSIAPISCFESVDDPRCQQGSGLTCPASSACDTPALCVRVCDVFQQCGVEGLGGNYDIIRGYTDGSNICVGFIGCSDCGVARKGKRDTLQGLESDKKWSRQVRSSVIRRALDGVIDMFEA